jgi:hypothetical protein
VRFLNLHEYQSKDLLESFGVQVQTGKPAASAAEAVEVGQWVHKKGMCVCARVCCWYPVDSVAGLSRFSGAGCAAACAAPAPWLCAALGRGVGLRLATAPPPHTPSLRSRRMSVAVCHKSVLGPLRGPSLRSSCC